MTDPDDIEEQNAARDKAILDAARRIIEQAGLSAISREAVAIEANLSPASVSNFGRRRISNGVHEALGYRQRILRDLMADAIERADLPMIRVGLVDGCLKRDTVPSDLLEAAGV